MHKIHTAASVPLADPGEERHMTTLTAAVQQTGAAHVLFISLPFLLYDHNVKLPYAT